MKTAPRPIAVYYEHPEWFRPLFAELDRRGVPYAKIDASRHGYDPSDTAEAAGTYSLVFNRMSASAYLRGNANALFYTRGYLAHLERAGARVVNGYDAFAVETSKALQLSLPESLGLSYPRTRVVNSAPEAARGRGVRVNRMVIIPLKSTGSSIRMTRSTIPIGEPNRICTNSTRTFSTVSRRIVS